MPPPNGGRAAHYPSLMVCGADKGGGPNQSRCRELLGQAGTQGKGGNGTGAEVGEEGCAPGMGG